MAFEFGKAQGVPIKTFVVEYGAWVGTIRCEHSFGNGLPKGHAAKTHLLLDEVKLQRTD